jgi:hypothetical protein
MALLRKSHRQAASRDEGNSNSVWALGESTLTRSAEGDNMIAASASSTVCDSVSIPSTKTCGSVQARLQEGWGPPVEGEGQPRSAIRPAGDQREMRYIIDVTVENDPKRTVELQGLPAIPEPGDTVALAANNGTAYGVVKHRHFQFESPNICRVSLVCIQDNP